MSKKVTVVTGGAGFIGSHLAEHLIRDGHTVRVIDNLATGKPENIALLGALGGDFTSIYADITQPDTLLPHFKDADTVFHMAALPSVPLSLANPQRTHEYCATGTLNVLDVSVKQGVRRVVYAGSSSAYGERPEPLMDENFPTHPISPYGASKLAGELYCQAFANSFPIETVILRYFNVFGARQDPTSHYSAVIPKFIKALLNTQIPIIYGDGTQTRDFVPIENVVHANILASAAPLEKGQVFNIGAGEAINLLTLMNTLNDLMGKQVIPHFQPAREGDILHSAASITKARSLLHYAPSVTLRAGLEKTIHWYEQAMA